MQTTIQKPKFSLSFFQNERWVISDGDEIITSRSNIEIIAAFFEKNGISPNDLIKKATIFYPNLLPQIEL